MPKLPTAAPLTPPKLSAGAYVALGGAVGATLRAILDVLAPLTVGALATSTIIVNLFGSFLMGVLTATWMRRRGQNTAWDRLKLLLGTGALGAFTTYSSFALALAHHLSWATLSEGILVVVGGVVAVAAGVFAATGERVNK